MTKHAYSKRISIEERVRAVLSSELGINAETIASHASLKENCGLDSVNEFLLIGALEDEFSVAMTDVDTEQHFKTLNTIVSYIETRLAECGTEDTKQ